MLTWISGTAMRAAGLTLLTLAGVRSSMLDAGVEIGSSLPLTSLRLKFTCELEANDLLAAISVNFDHPRHAECRASAARDIQAFDVRRRIGEQVDGFVQK